MKAQQIFVEQGSPEWHELRKTKIGASDANVLMGTVTYKKRNDILAEKKGFVKQNDYIKAIGDSVEREVQALFPEYAPAVFVKGNLIASLDLWNGKDIIEIKSSSDLNFEKYLPQCQLQMHVVDVPCMMIIMRDSFGTLHQKTFFKDEEYIEKMLVVIDDFYKEMTKGEDVDLQTLLDEYNAIKGKEDELKEKIFEKIKSSTIIGNYKITISKSEDKQVPDYESTMKLYNIEPLMKTKPGITTRRITCLK